MLGRVRSVFPSRTISITTRLASTAQGRKANGVGKKYELLICNLTKEDVRCVSTASNTSKAPGNPEPPPVIASESFLEVKLPAPDVDPGLQIRVPYVPDFWDSAKFAPDTVVAEVPKVIVVGGTETYHGGGPAHALDDVNIPIEKDSSEMDVGRSESFLDDIAEDLQLPPVQEIKSSFRKLFSQ